MNKKKIAIIIVLVLAVPVVALVGVFALLQSSRAVNALAASMQPMTGVYLHVDDIFLNHHLDGHVNGLQVKAIKKNSFAISLARAEINGNVGHGLKIELERLVLIDPNFTFYLKKEKSKIDPFAVLRKMPRIHLLAVKNAQLEMKSDSSVYSMLGMDVTIRNFEPEGRGKLNSKGRFHINSKDMATQGIFELVFDVSRFSPQPSGSGSFRFFLDNGFWYGTKLDSVTFTSGLKLNGDVFSLDNAKAVIRSLSPGQRTGQLIVKEIQAQFNASYNQKTSGFSLISFEGSGAGIGLLKGQASGTVKPLTWDASLHASSLDITQAFSLAKPLLPENYRNWTFKGRSSLEVETQGKPTNNAVIWSAKAIIDLSEGGFASADSSKAGERMSGRIKLKLASPEKGRKGSFNITMEGGDGELLWGTYYQDFKGKKIKLTSQGAFTQNPFFLSCSGICDLFQTGNYAFSADTLRDRTLLSLKAKNISLQRLFNVLMQNYINQNYPNLQDLKLEGTSDLKLTALISPQQKMIEGDFTLRGGAIHSPSNKLTLTGLNISLPYDLVLAGNPAPVSSLSARQGSVAFDMFEKDNIRISKIEIPVILSGNRFIIPDPIGVPIFGGEVHLAGFRMENLLRPEMRVETGIAIKHLNLGEMIEQAESLPLTGTIDGDFSSIVFQDGKWTTRGGIVAQVFGGRITIENLFAGRLLSSSRFFGVDASFDNIDLEAATASIKVGRVTGLIKGSLKNFRMEYGQPSRFDLVIRSDRSRKVPQRISVDAIKNLSVISTGSGAMSAILGSGVNRFFKDYPYSRIGIRCNLTDDVFFLRGLIHDAGNEYLVRKALFRGIDIVNQNPDNAISFKDMEERVGRIYQSRPETKDSP